MDSIKELEANIRQAKDAIELGNALERLFSNRDFKKIILNGYFEKEAVRLVRMKAAFDQQSEVAQQSCVKQIDAIGSMAEYLDGITTRAALARKEIDADEQTRDEIIFEDLNNG